MFIDFSDRIYTRLGNYKGKFYSLLRLSFRVLFSYFAEIYFLLFPSNLVRLPEVDEEELIVSLTSFPLRIAKVWIVVECLLRQSLLPNKIILTLAKSQFPNQKADLPRNLKRYINRNQLTVLFVDDDLRSHKKYFYSFQESPEAAIVLVDDDIFYPSNILQDLYVLHKKYPKTIIAHRSYDVKRNFKGNLCPYNDWKYSRSYELPLKNVFHTSGAGTLYKPKWFDRELFNVQLIKSLCFNADDVWLNIHAQRCDIPTVKTSYNSLLLPVVRVKDVKLKSLNKDENLNDMQIKNVIEYYNLNQDKVFV